MNGDFLTRYNLAPVTAMLPGSGNVLVLPAGATSLQTVERVPIGLFGGSADVAALQMAVTTLQGEVTALQTLTASLNHVLQVRAAGTAYTLTTSPALVDFGTTDPVLTLDRAGTWFIVPFAAYQANGATFAASQQITTQVQRQNNTPVTLSASNGSERARVMTTQTEAIPARALPFTYFTPRTDDQIALWSSIAGLPSAGTVTCIIAQIVAILLIPA